MIANTAPLPGRWRRPIWVTMDSTEVLASFGESRRRRWVGKAGVLLCHGYLRLSVQTFRHGPALRSPTPGSSRRLPARQSADSRFDDRPYGPCPSPRPRPLGRTLHQVTGHDVDETAPLDIEVDLAGLSPASLSIDNLIASLDLLRRRYRSSTLQRLCSTLRSFCRWCVRRGHLTSSPFDNEILHVTYRHEPEIRAFAESEIDAMLEAAITPAKNAWSGWGARDVAAVDVLAFTGVRAAAFCALQVGDVGSTDRPILYIRRGAKGNKRPEVPLPPTPPTASRCIWPNAPNVVCEWVRVRSCSCAMTGGRCRRTRCIT